MTDYIIDINGQEILIENVQSDYRTRFGSQLRDVRTGLWSVQSLSGSYGKACPCIG